MVGIAFRSEAPVQVIRCTWVVNRAVALVALAQTIATRRFTAAVIVGNDVVDAIDRVFTGANPGDGRHLRAGRARIDGAATTATQEAIDSAITPVVTTTPITLFFRKSPCFCLRAFRRPGKRSG